MILISKDEPEPVFEVEKCMFDSMLKDLKQIRMESFFENKICFWDLIHFIFIVIWSSIK